MNEHNGQLDCDELPEDYQLGRRDISGYRRVCATNNDIEEVPDFKIFS